MARLMNLDAETGANIIDDDAQPTLTLANTSTGPGLKVDDLVATAGATIVTAELVNSNRIVATAVGTTALTVQRTVVGNSSTAVMVLGASGASIPVLGLSGSAFTSAVSIVFAASGNWAGLGAVRVLYPDGTTYGWIPVLPSAVVTAGVFA